MAKSNPKMDLLKPEVNSQVSGYGANNPIFNGKNNPGGNQIQGGNFNGPFNIGGTHTTTNQNNKQIGGGGNNPQVQGNISASSGSKIGLGVEAAHGVRSRAQ